jgi:hypothetical protein
MHGSIATHHVEYRVGSRSTAGSALVPSLDRAIRSALEEAITRRLALAFGDDEAVVVVREAHASVTLNAQDCVLSSAVVDRVSAAAADAVVATVTSPATDDSVARFASQIEFLGTFIVEVIAGTAWDRWFFGPLRAYRRQTAEETIAAVLADNDAAAIVEWMKTRGHHDAVAFILARDVLSRSELERLQAARDRDDLSKTSPLADTAFQLLRAMGWTARRWSARDAHARYLALHPGLPDWTSMRSLSAWVARFVRFTIGTNDEDESPQPPLSADAADPLLAGSLDWLDVAWLRGELRAIVEEIEERASEPPLRVAPVQSEPIAERVIERLTERIRDRGFDVLSNATPDVLVSRLLALVAEDRVDAGAGHAAVGEILRRVASAWLSFVDRQPHAIPWPADGASPTEAPAANTACRELDVRVALEKLRDVGPQAAALFRELVRTSQMDVEGGTVTTAGGLFLLTRPVLDVRLPALAREVSAPLECVLGRIACSLFELQVPLDAASAFWVGSANPDFVGCPADDRRIVDLERSLELLLLDQYLNERDIERDTKYSPMAALIVRAWARWLPGVHGASVPFLLRNCLARRARVRVSEGSIDVLLDPAPLDVVLEMVGCFRPIEIVPWLGSRRMNFAINTSAPV